MTPATAELIRSAYAAYLRTPGLDAFRARPAEDRNFDVFTVRHRRIVALRACRDRAEALAQAGLV